MLQGQKTTKIRIDGTVNKFIEDSFTAHILETPGTCSDESSPPYVKIVEHMFNSKPMVNTPCESVQILTDIPGFVEN